MQKSSIQTAAASLLPAVITMLFVQACGVGGPAIADPPSRDPFEGVWEATVTQRQCDSGAVLGTFRGAQVVHHGGTLSDTNASPPASRGPGFGVWQRSTEGVYDLRFRFYRYNADGSVAGITVVRSTRHLGEDGNSYVGDAQAEQRDMTGKVLATVCVTDVGTRFGLL